MREKCQSNDQTHLLAMSASELPVRWSALLGASRIIRLLLVNGLV